MDLFNAEEYFKSLSQKNKLSVKTTEQFKKELAEINQNIKVVGEYINNKTKISVECLVCGYKKN